MKKSINGFDTIKHLVYSFVLLVGTLLFTGCKKEAINIDQAETNKEVQGSLSNTTNMKSDAGFMKMYSGLGKQTTFELQQARAATARYRNIENALKDGYTNINVDVENMGHHYMKGSLVEDGTFDIRNPEILVYNGNEEEGFELVAVEYAIPLTFSRPEGFTGSLDVWNDTSGFPLWLLHAWVWAYNPAGVFNPTNSLIHLHQAGKTGKKGDELYLNIEC